jgi:hypothetical protein
MPLGCLHRLLRLWSDIEAASGFVLCVLLVWLKAGKVSSGVPLQGTNPSRRISLADIKMDFSDVRFAPESGHAHRRNRCPLCGKKTDVGRWQPKLTSSEADDPILAAY